jgi:hypothetical protein
VAIGLKIKEKQPSQVEDQNGQSRLKIETINMEKVMQTRFKLLGSTALAAAALVIGASAASADGHKALEKRVKAIERTNSQQVTRSKKTMNLTVSGHVARHISFVDNGLTSGIIHATNSLSQSRVRWIGTGKLTDDWSVMTNIELGNDSALSGNQSLDDRNDTNGAAALTNRFAEIRLINKSLGTIYIGQGATGADGVSERDLSGTGLVALPGAGGSVGGGAEFFTSNNAATAVTVASVFSSFDSLGRQTRLRYDTPSFGGFQVTGSHGNGDRTTVALRYGGKMGDVSVTGAIGYTNISLSAGQEIVNGSVSVLMPMGLSLTFGASESDRDAGRTDGSWRYGKIGYKFKGSELGETRLFAEYSYNEDVQANNDEAEYFGAGVIQIVEPLGAELYMLYRNFDLDRPGTPTDDVDATTVGIRVAF